ncbi:MAG: cyclopropane-fatty-acyl-phospholipid synthase [Mycobacterium sp.]|nr:cyclopropane-fatty-acyl-phospholipid synthase [Mycobacterium sp.]
MGIVSSIADRVAELFRTTIGIDPPVRIRAWDGSEAGPADGPVLVIRSRRALRRLLWRPGELGLARGYVTRDIDVEGDLADGLRRAWRLARAHPGAAISARGRATAALHALRLGALGPPPKVPASEARLSGPLHTRRRDRAVIAHHYDLSNEFYQLLLDDHMAYSAAYFTHEEQSLHDAQTAKLDLICTKLDLKPGMQMLDVGCGWGSLVLHAVERYGVRATGITLSAQQREFVVTRATERGLVNSIDVRLQDYRDFGDLPTSRDAFDAVASIEMGEHVGEQFYPSYAGILYRALKPGASVLLQQMSRRPDAAPGGGAFIEAYIAPDMHMRPLWQTLRHLQNADFEIRSVEAMRQHYARTAQHWIDTLEQRFAEFVALLGEEVARVWRLYLVGGMLAFEEGRMGVDQILATKPR